jgi:hypothetical protein
MSKSIQAAVSVLHWTGCLEESFPKERQAVIKRIRTMYAPYRTGTQRSQYVYVSSRYITRCTCVRMKATAGKRLPLGLSQLL